MFRSLQSDSVATDSFDKEFLEFSRRRRKKQSYNLASIGVLTDGDHSRATATAYRNISERDRVTGRT